MFDEYDDNVVDLNAYREQKEKEERERLEQEERDEYEYLSSLVHSFMTNLGSWIVTGKQHCHHTHQTLKWHIISK